jgi:hypothetical protein
MKSVATASGDVNAQPSLAMSGLRNSCYSSSSAIKSTPTPADMVFEIRFAYTYILQGTAGFGTNFEFRLRMPDPKSGIVLWAFTESMPQSSNKTKAEGYFAQTLGTLIADLKNLTNRNLANH